MKDTRTLGERLADNFADKLGSWKFIIYQTVFIAVWMILNVIGFIYEWDKYPFIFLNLIFSIMSAFSAPIILMSQNRQNAKDREKAEKYYEINLKSKKEITELIEKLERIEIDKLDRIINKLEEERIELPSVDEAVMIEVAKKFCDINKFTGGFLADEQSFISGAEWQARRILQQLETLEIAKLLDSEEPPVIYEPWMAQMDMDKIEEILEQLRKKHHE